MTTESQQPKSPRARKKAKPSALGVVAVAQRLQALSLLPLHAMAEGRKQSIPSLLHDMTGLSKARISQGNLDAIRPSTQAKVDQHQEELLQEQFKDNVVGLEALRQKIAAAPVLSSGAPAPLASWVHQYEFLPWIPLTLTKAVALTMDELLETLLHRCRDEDLPGFKNVLLAHFECHGLVVRAMGEPVAETAPDPELIRLRAVTDWEGVDHCTLNLTEHLYWDLISALDAEWSSAYFSGRQTAPLFPLVMVRPQEGLLETMKVSSRKNIYFKPVRRLLEYLYALAFYFRYRRWPARAPAPKKLAGILYRPGEQELAEESLVSNYFDGTTRLTLDRVLNHWEQMLQHFMPSRPETERPNAPVPLIVLALQWQTVLVQDKGQSFLMPDLQNYDTRWRHRRAQWLALQAPHDAAGANTGQRPGEPIDWPAWTFSQSSSSS